LAQQVLLFLKGGFNFLFFKTGGIMLSNDLSGKVALVCGSSQGIGAAAARALAQMGATIVAVARSQDLLTEMLLSLPNNNHRSFVCDFSKVDMVSNLGQTIGSLKVDIIVNNSGGPGPNPVEFADPSEYLVAFQSHLLAAVVLTKAVLPSMKIKKWGRVINIVSISGKTPVANLAVSNSVRGAVINWGKTLSNEVAIDGITVNNVLPGYTLTSRLENLNLMAAERSGKSLDQIESGLLSQIPAGRFGKPEEIAAAIAFFASPSSSFVTGTSMAVDGGWSKFS
jgi:3-oxoacyl-[acyl-carrier protein] reductase